MIPRSRCRRFAWFVLSFTSSMVVCHGANINAAPGEAGLRAAVAQAQPGDSVTLTNTVTLAATVRIDKPITLRGSRPSGWDTLIEGAFTNELLHLATNGIRLENLRLYGDLRADGFRIEGNVTVSNCVIQNVRRPVMTELWPYPPFLLRMEEVLVTDCVEGVNSWKLEARDCTFTKIGGPNAVNVLEADMLRCRFEQNTGNGLACLYGSIRDSTFRLNGGFGLAYDPDPGVLNISGCVFYANASGGAYLGEQATVTADNCTFTRHTGSPAIIVSQADAVLLRHCTIVDNLLFDPDSSPWYPWGGAVSIGGYRVELQNCIVAENPTSDDPDASGMSGEWIDGGGNVIGGTAGLGALRNNGGPTLTMAPLTGSAAINAGVASEIVMDARRLSRLAGSAPDAGAMEANAAAVMDSDGDGMPDIWETFFSLNATNAADAASDGDGDGFTALAEYRNWTNPTNAGSAMRIERFNVGLDYDEPRRPFVTVLWKVVPGVTYRLETSTDLREWKTAIGYTFTDYLPLNRPALQFTGPSESPMAFYRLSPVERR